MARIEALNLSHDRLYGIAGEDSTALREFSDCLQKSRLTFARLRVASIVRVYNLARTEKSFVEWVVKQDSRVAVVKAYPQARHKDLLGAARLITQKGESPYIWMCSVLTVALNEELAFQSIPGRLEAYRKKASKYIQFRYTPAP